MTKEQIREKAFEFVSERASGMPKEMEYYAEILTQFVVEKIIGNGIEWHDLRKDPNDLPTEEKEFLVYTKEWGIEIRGYFADDKYFSCRRKIVIAWCEIPQFTE